MTSFYDRRAALKADLFEEIVNDGRHKLHALLPTLNSTECNNFTKKAKFQLSKHCTRIADQIDILEILAFIKEVKITFS